MNRKHDLRSLMPALLTNLAGMLVLAKRAGIRLLK